MNPFADTLHLTVRPSAIHRTLNAALHLLSVAVIVAMASYRLPILALSIPAAFSFWLCARRIAQASSNSLIALRISGDGAWHWQTADGRWQPGECTCGHVYGSTLVSLELRPEAARWRSRWQLVWIDALTADEHRRLRARLTISPPGRVDDVGA